MYNKDYLMLEFNKLSYEIKDFLDFNKFNNDIKFIKCLDDENNNYEIELLYNNKIIKIFTNIYNYCFLNSNEIACDELNKLIFYNKAYKSYEKIIDIIDNYNNITNIRKKIDYTDKYHFFTKIIEKTKISIDFSLIKKNNMSNSIIKNINIPKELLLNSNQINQLIINEIKKINSNYEYYHFIQPVDNNIFHLRANLFDNNSNWEINEYKPIILDIILDNNLYPFLPPKIEIISPKIKLPLYFAIMNLNITKINNWHSSLSIEWIITNLFLKLESIINNYVDNNEENNIIKNITRLAILRQEIVSDGINIDLIINKVINENKKENILYWKSGTGYSSNISNDKWDIKTYIKEKHLLNLEISKCLDDIGSCLDDNSLIYINQTDLLKYLINITKELTILEIELNTSLFTSLINILLKLISYETSLIDCSNSDKLQNISLKLNNNFIRSIINSFKSINDEVIILFENDESLQNNELYLSICHVYQKYVEMLIEDKSDLDKDESFNSENINEYCNIMKPLQFKLCNLNTNNLFASYAKNKIDPSSLKRIISEVTSFKNNLPLNDQSTIWIRVPKSNMNIFSFLISGPKDTPYENGLFEFNAYLPHNYPNDVPKVLLVTTGNRTVRFNPNLYNCGKVCLSLLGTWSGNESEKWNSKTSTFLQVLISIQSLILVEQPYFNEPGYEREINTEKGKIKSDNYNDNIKVQNIKWAMTNQILNPPKDFEEVVKEHFRLKKDNIIKTTQEWENNCSSKYKIEMSNVIKNLVLQLNKI
jgi:ubiquitin-protein ligase